MASTHDEVLKRLLAARASAKPAPVVEQGLMSQRPGISTPSKQQEGATSSMDYVVDFISKLSSTVPTSAAAEVRQAYIDPLNVSASELYDRYNTPPYKFYHFNKENQGMLEYNIGKMRRESMDNRLDLDMYISEMEKEKEKPSVMPKGTGLMSTPRPPARPLDDMEEPSDKSTLKDRLIDSVFRAEGGYSTDKKDTGNYYAGKFIGTNHGVSAPVLAAYLGREPTVEDMKKLTKEEARTIAGKQYYDRFSIDKLPEELQEIVFHSVYLGESRGVKALQKVLGVDSDGVIGPKTKEAMGGADFTKEEFKDAFLDELKKTKTWKVHGKGWTNRFNALVD